MRGLKQNRGLRGFNGDMDVVFREWAWFISTLLGPQPRLLSRAELPEVCPALLLRQTRQRLEEAVVVGIVGVVLDLGEGEELGPGRERVGIAGGALAKVWLGLGLGEGQRVVEGRVTSVAGHAEA